MIRDREGYKFDLPTQRFIVNRWSTKHGERVRDEIISGIKNSVELRAILDPYVLHHSENTEPYGYPVYPKDVMNKDDFWVLTSDDLRGIQFYNEDFSESRSLEVKSLSYCSFYNCDLTGANLERTELSYARFDRCKLDRVVFAAAGGFSTRLKNCSAKNACMWSSGFMDCDFSGTDLTGAYFEDAVIEDVTVNYLTRIDIRLNTRWKSRVMPPEQGPDVLRAIRIAYERAELSSLADRFLLSERTEQRRHVLWPRLSNDKSPFAFSAWAISLISGWSSGYSTKPTRVLMIGLFAAFLFAGVYVALGAPSGLKGNTFLEAIYFSLTTFCTLGYGDIAYGSAHPLLRIFSALEGWLGATLISLFVVVLARKIFR